MRLALGSQASTTGDVFGEGPEDLVEDLAWTDVQDLAHRVQPPMVLVDRPRAVPSTHAAQANRIVTEQVCSMHCSLAGLQQPRLRIADVSRTWEGTDGVMAPGVGRQVAVRTLGWPSHAFAEGAGKRRREAPVGEKEKGVSKRPRPHGQCHDKVLTELPAGGIVHTTSWAKSRNPLSIEEDRGPGDAAPQ